MWTIDDDHGIPGEGSRDDTTPRRCPGCGAADRAGDDFCHECGHTFAHLRSTGDGAEPQGEQCPMCPSGELTALDHGRTQCDACGYMARDIG